MRLRWSQRSAIAVSVLCKHFIVRDGGAGESGAPVRGPFRRETRGSREWVVFARCASSAWLGGVAVARR